MQLYKKKLLVIKLVQFIDLRILGAFNGLQIQKPKYSNIEEIKYLLLRKNLSHLSIYVYSALYI